MHPLLIKIGSVPIHTYGCMIALGFLLALWTARRLALRSGLGREKVMDLAFWCLISGFIGARLLFVITQLDFFLAEPLQIFQVWNGGLVFWGGPLVAVPFGIFFMKRNKMPIWRTMDVIVPGLTIAHLFGRFGCLAAGCCYGKPTTEPWGVRLYSELVDEPLRGVPLHPTQLYEAAGLGVLYFGLLWIYRHRKFDGQVALSYFIAYPILRSIIEIFRGDVIRGFVIDGVVSTSQFISFLVFLVATTALVLRLRHVESASRVSGGRIGSSPGVKA